MAYTVVSHFTKSDPDVRTTYAAILEAARKLGKVQEDPKKTSIHLVRASAFAGVAARASRSRARIRRTEQTSANRWHMEMRLTSPAEVDAELRQWLAEAYALA